jgi:phosphopantetheinyl transferase
VSITHRDRRAIAVAVFSGRIGIDLERIEARPESMGEDWFHPSERRWLAHRRDATVAWTIKEAVSKALGLGLALSPREIVVLGITAGEATVALHGEAARRHAALGGGDLRVTWRLDTEDHVLAEVRIAA